MAFVTSDCWVIAMKRCLMVAVPTSLRVCPTISIVFFCVCQCLSSRNSFVTLVTFTSQTITETWLRVNVVFLRFILAEAMYLSWLVIYERYIASGFRNFPFQLDHNVQFELIASKWNAANPLFFGCSAEPISLLLRIRLKMQDVTEQHRASLGSHALSEQSHSLGYNK